MDEALSKYEMPTINREQAKPDIKVAGLGPMPIDQEENPDLQQIIESNVAKIDQTPLVGEVDKTEKTEFDGENSTNKIPLVNETKKSKNDWVALTPATPVKDVTGISTDTWIRFQRAGTAGFLEGKVINFVKDPNCLPDKHTMAPQVRLTDKRITLLDAVNCDDLIIATKRPN